MIKASDSEQAAKAMDGAKATHHPLLKASETGQNSTKGEARILREPAWTVRPAKAEDVRYMMSCWLRTLRSQPDPLPDDLFFASYRPLVIRLLATSQTRVAHALDNPDRILGFSVSWDSDKVLHWVYVRDAIRNHGIGKALISHLGPQPVHTMRTWATRTTFRSSLGPYQPHLTHRLGPETTAEVKK